MQSSTTYKLKFRSDIGGEQSNIVGQIEVIGREYERVAQHCLPHDSVHLAGAKAADRTLGTSL